MRTCEKCHSVDVTTTRRDTGTTTTCHACGYVAAAPRAQQPERSAAPDAADVTRPATPTTTRD